MRHPSRPVANVIDRARTGRVHGRPCAFVPSVPPPGVGVRFRGRGEGFRIKFAVGREKHPEPVRRANSNSPIVIETPDRVVDHARSARASRPPVWSGPASGGHTGASRPSLRVSGAGRGCHPRRRSSPYRRDARPGRETRSGRAARPRPCLRGLGGRGCLGGGWGWGFGWFGGRGGWGWGGCRGGWGRGDWSRRVGGSLELAQRAGALAAARLA